ncbi:EscU/YscU/HrcU family type III secretion system export apparatus switch protein [Neomoorella thermoacetica]|uniref:Flagellar biosynthetic protein FlhB n=3 Tax=Neomoorella thermoacetica TaxID=1525 RepID=A0AAC9MUI2_NEOTH|nr:EscU/YscU/HrcU family type III secretion system export apparatus switch protein [Moorella thermoacetica]AKX96404.1 flagellar biosynthetic protein FlhB [Moorella thermoacetica]AOQ23684.1 Flagellar biosynthetic protein FlhB [Moorella thermoacetica]OIQ54965.1 flagellar biosynthetic protein FlhB [Moorella thermoacetica]OIQ55863.1 flagellar biosynthetic protein FlhB [Moorella thermoacetica]OIQ62173.1 flagellar biosynthetic protein FlhB [Moorella thermoacetica]
MKERERIRKAVALRYNSEEDKAPRVVASGRGAIADKIITAAREAGVPIHRDTHLAEMLAGLDVGSEIPVELYQMVAEILVFIYSLDQSRGKSGK